MSAAVRAVLDTNVVLSALLFGQGRLSGLRAGWQRGMLIPLVSKETVAELIRALGYPKFGLSSEQQEELLADFLPHCETVKLPRKLPSSPPCRDPDDVAFLHLATVGKADVLVSGDGDLLSIAGKFACPIIPPGELLARLAADT